MNRLEYVLELLGRDATEKDAAAVLDELPERFWELVRLHLRTSGEELEMDELFSQAAFEALGLEF